MGEAKRRKQLTEQIGWTYGGDLRGMIDLHMLPPVATINGTRIRALTGDATIPDASQIPAV